MRSLFGVIRPSLTTHQPWRISPRVVLTRPPWTLQYARWKHQQTTTQEVENTNVSHSRFIAEASPQTNWNEGKDQAGKPGENGMEPSAEEFDKLTEGKGTDLK